jgi:hypothetical protein
MKYLALFSLLAGSVALAEDNAPTTPLSGASKTEETVTLSEEATAPLFDRVRGAHLRAQKNGSVAVRAETLPEEVKK